MVLNKKSVIPFPIEEVYLAMRDHMPELAEYMPNIESIDVQKREEIGSDELKLINRWNAASTEIPKVARPFVKPDKTYWLDHAHWENSKYRCNWSLEMGFMPDRIKCEGFTDYVAIADDKTEMRISGKLELHLKGLVPRFFLGKATSGIEKFVGGLVQPNFQKTSDALTAFLRAQSS